VEGNDPDDVKKGKKSSRVVREWFTPTEAMQYLGVSRPTLYHLMDSGVLKFYTLKGVQKRRIKKEDLDALFEEGKSSNAATARKQNQTRRKSSRIYKKR
jgi:excisionase family DNA binding protein